MTVPANSLPGHDSKSVILEMLRHPVRKLTVLSQYFEQVRHADKLSHAEVVFLGRKFLTGRNRPGDQMIHLAAHEFLAPGATVKSLLPCAWTGFAPLVRNFPIAAAASAFHILGGVHLVTEKLSPAVDKLLPHGGIIGARRAQVTVVAAVTDHFFL